MHKVPLISIVTVCYNAENLIEKTIRSVLNQKQSQLIEYIIIDGLSQDQTMGIVAKYNKRISTIVSEKDNGIYDAMNKGINQATGEYILFLNAGDYLFGNDLIPQIKANPIKADIFYSDTILFNNKSEILGSRSHTTTRKLPRNLTKNSFKKGLVVSHQSFIPKRVLIPYYIENNLSADIDWIIKCCSNAENTHCLKQPISCFLVGGISDQKKLISLRDRFWVMNNHFGLAQTISLHLFFILRFILKKLNIAI